MLQISGARHPALTDRPGSLAAQRSAIAVAFLLAACGARAPEPQPPTAPHDPPPPEAPAPPTPALDEWWRSGSFGSYLAPVPLASGIRSDGTFDVVFHFHLAKSAEPEYRAAGMRAVIVASATHGLFANGYRDAYADPERFARDLHELELLIAARAGRPVKVGRVALIGWSAGYGAVRKILAQPAYERVDAVVLLDGLHTAYRPSRNGVPSRDTMNGRDLDERDIEPFTRFARDAAAGTKLFYFTHTAIVPHGYASTTECADFLVREAGATRTPVEDEPAPGNLVLKSRADRGDFHVRGYAGEDKGSHVAQLRLIERIVNEMLLPRWHGG